MTTNRATCEAIWLRKLLVSLFRKRMEATKVYYDNQSCIKLSENPIFHDWSKHIDIRCHFIRDCVQRGPIRLQYVPTGLQVADILTKSLGRAKFTRFRERMGMVENLFQQQQQFAVQGQLAVAVATTTQMQTFKGSCSTNVALAVAVSMATVQLQQERISWWTTCYTSATQRTMLQSQSSMQQQYIARANSSLRGSVDLRQHWMCSRPQNLQEGLDTYILQYLEIVF